MELIIIILLLAYIAFLQYQLYKKGQVVESLMQRMLDFEKQFNVDELMRALQRKEIDQSSKVMTNLLDSSVQRFILEDEASCKMYVHYTRTEEVAHTILSDGFHFVNSFHKTAEPVSNDQTSMIYKHHLYKNYGKIIVVIGISQSIYNHYTNEIANKRGVVNVEQLLCEVPPYLNEDDDEVYLLPNQFVKGYVSLESGSIVVNPNYNPFYDSRAFSENVEKLNV